jgi:hypothetical protein
VGTSRTATDDDHVFLYDGKMHDITALAIAAGVPGASEYVIPEGFNALGHIALNIGPLTQLRPAVYKKGRFVLLHPERLVKSGERIGAASARKINDFGQVVGVYQDAARGFIATPISLLFQRLWDATVNFPGVHATEGAAWTAYAQYNVSVSDTQLAKFIKDVGTLVAQKKLSAALGNKWLADAQAIRAAMRL